MNGLTETKAAATSAFHPSAYLQHFVWGTADAEIKVHSFENPELTNMFTLKPGVSQNITMHALPTARNFFLVLICIPFRSIQLNFFQVPSLVFNCVNFG